MDGNGIAAIVGATGGAAVALIGAFFNQRRLSKKQDSTSITSNYQLMFDGLRKDIGRLRDEQNDDRKQWAEERKLFNDKIDKLQELVRDQDKALHAKEVEVTELRGRIEVLTVQLETYRAATPTKAITVNT